VGSAAGAAPPQATSNGNNRAAAKRAALRFHDEATCMCSDPFEENGNLIHTHNPIIESIKQASNNGLLNVCEKYSQ
jgi:hypothetical protein